MGGVFVLLFLVSLTGLVWGLAAPRHLAKIVKVSRPVTRKHTGLVFGFFAVLFLVLIGATAPQQPAKLQKANLTAASSSSQAATDNVTTKQTTETQTTAFAVKDEDDGSLSKGQTQIAQAGKNGTKTLVYKITYTNGQQTGKTLISNKVTKQPVNQIVKVGTYVAPEPQSAASVPAPHSSSPTNCTNRTYVNSSGNTVCRPEAASSAPAGATAKCRDGTYSFSQHHSGTCSGHGGVAEWL